jgi:CBS domain-containing protein
MRRLHKTIFEIGWSRTVPRLAETDTAWQALDLMRSEAHDCVLVLRGDKLAGIFTSRDFLNRVVAEKRDPKTTSLGQVMTPTPRTLQARDEVAFAINWMAVEGFRNVPIVDSQGYPLGVLTVFDVMGMLQAVLDDIAQNPRENLGEFSSVSKIFDVGGGG